LTGFEDFEELVAVNAKYRELFDVATEIGGGKRQEQATAKAISVVSASPSLGPSAERRSLRDGF